MATSDILITKDSRKRGFGDDGMESSIKRFASDQIVLNTNDENSNVTDSSIIYVKILVPSSSAGAIIGKAGETIAQLQKENNATIRMSKANDFYPGTSDRICLISSTQPESILTVVNFIISKCTKQCDVSSGRHVQLKILVTNLDAGKIIGKGGSYIKQIQDTTGATIQISQKNDSLGIPERIVTVTGNEESVRKTSSLIVAKIQEAPSSIGNCCLSYSSGDKVTSDSNVLPKKNGLGSLIVHLDPPRWRAPQPLVDLVIAGLPGAYAAQGYPTHIASELACALTTLSKYGMLSLVPEPQSPTPVNPLLAAKSVMVWSSQNKR